MKIFLSFFSVNRLNYLGNLRCRCGIFAREEIRWRRRKADEFGDESVKNYVFLLFFWYVKMKNENVRKKNVCFNPRICDCFKHFQTQRWGILFRSLNFYLKIFFVYIFQLLSIIKRCLQISSKFKFYRKMHQNVNKESEKKNSLTTHAHFWLKIITKKVRKKIAWGVKKNVNKNRWEARRPSTTSSILSLIRVFLSSRS